MAISAREFCFGIRLICCISKKRLFRQKKAEAHGFCRCLCFVYGYRFAAPFFSALYSS